MIQRINKRRLLQLILISALSTVLIITGGCDFISNIFSKKNKAVENAYIEYRKAFMAGDIETLKKLIAKDKAYELEDKQVSAKLELARALYPTNVTITGTYIEGNAATLTASADSQDGKIQGTIHLLKEDGRWKVYEENWETKIGMTESPQTMPPSQTAEIPSKSGSDLFTQQPMENKEPGGATGEAVIVKDGITETYILKDSFFSDTRFKNPKRANIEFQIPGGEHSNARRIEMTLDATRSGNHYVYGKDYSIFDEDKINIGESTPDGYRAIFKFMADGGQIFPPKESCIINVTSPYSGNTDGIFSGEISDCVVHSAGIDYTISSVKFTMKGIPSH